MRINFDLTIGHPKAPSDAFAILSSRRPLSAACLLRNAAGPQPLAAHPSVGQLPGAAHAEIQTHFRGAQSWVSLVEWPRASSREGCYIRCQMLSLTVI